MPDISFIIQMFRVKNKNMTIIGLEITKYFYICGENKIINL
jgi:hypothetical protein